MPPHVIYAPGSMNYTSAAESPLPPGTPDIGFCGGDGPVGTIADFEPGPLGAPPSTRCTVCGTRRPAAVMLLTGTTATGLYFTCPDHDTPIPVPVTSIGGYRETADDVARNGGAA